MAERGSSFFVFEPPFFVVDQVGRPLMPLSKRQGRVRLGRVGGHRVVEHHAFSILQLDKPVLAAELHLRDLVVAVRFEQRAADLLIAAGTKVGVAAVVRIVVDLDWISPADNHNELLLASIDQSRFPKPELFAAAVTAVIAELQHWLPLNAAALPFNELTNDARTTSGYRGWRQDVILHLLSQIADLDLKFYVQPTRIRPEAIDVGALRQTFTQIASNASSVSTFAARVMNWSYPPLLEKQSLLLPRELTSSDVMELTKQLHRGEELGETTMLDGQHIRGIIDRRLFERKLVLFVPVLLPFLRIAWHGIDISEVNEVPANERARFIRIYQRT